MEDRTYKRIWLAVLVLSMVAAGSAKGRTITVGLDAGYDFGTIQSAIDDSNDGDVVLGGGIIEKSKIPATIRIPEGKPSHTIPTKRELRGR